MMYSPAHIDGCTVVILRRQGFGYAVVESGRLAFDGEVVTLEAEETSRIFSDTEIDLLKLVVAGNRIPECQGFHLFLIQSPQTS